MLLVWTPRFDSDYARPCSSCEGFEFYPQAMRVVEELQAGK